MKAFANVSLADELQSAELFVSPETITYLVQTGGRAQEEGNHVIKVFLVILWEESRPISAAHVENKASIKSAEMQSRCWNLPYLQHALYSVHAPQQVQASTEHAQHAGDDTWERHGLQHLAGSWKNRKGRG